MSNMLNIKNVKQSKRSVYEIKYYFVKISFVIIGSDTSCLL